MITPVITAHPTEVRRKSTLDRETAIAALLDASGGAGRAGAEEIEAALNEPTTALVNYLVRLAALDERPLVLLLDEADGCDSLTVFDCLLFPVVKKSAITTKLGSVSPARRRHLHQTIAAVLRLFQ